MDATKSAKANKINITLMEFREKVDNEAIRNANTSDPVSVRNATDIISRTAESIVEKLSEASPSFKTGVTELSIKFTPSKGDESMLITTNDGVAGYIKYIYSEESSDKVTDDTSFTIRRNEDGSKSVVASYIRNDRRWRMDSMGGQILDYTLYTDGIIKGEMSVAGYNKFTYYGDAGKRLCEFNSGHGTPYFNWANGISDEEAEAVYKHLPEWLKVD